MDERPRHGSWNLSLPPPCNLKDHPPPCRGFCQPQVDPEPLREEETPLLRTVPIEPRLEVRVSLSSKIREPAHQPPIWPFILVGWSLIWLAGVRLGNPGTCPLHAGACPCRVGTGPTLALMPTWHWHVMHTLYQLDTDSSGCQPDMAWLLAQDLHALSCGTQGITIPRGADPRSPRDALPCHAARQLPEGCADMCDMCTRLAG